MTNPARHPAVIALLSALIAVHAWSWVEMFNSQSTRTSLDFLALYSAGRIAQDAGYAHVYDIGRQRIVQESVRGFSLGDQVLLYNHLPYFLPLLRAAVSTSYEWSLVRWSAFLCVIYLVAARYWSRWIRDCPGWVVTAALVSWFPLFRSIWHGQETAFLFLGFTIWAIGILRDRTWLGAAGLALTSMKPHLCLALAVPVMFRWSMLWRAVALLSALALYSVWLIGVEGLTDLIELVTLTARGEWFGIRPERMLNVAGIVHRASVSLEPAAMSIIAWIVYFIGLAAIGLLWWRSDASPRRLLAATVLIALVTAPHLHLHDLTLLAVPLLLVLVDDASRISARAMLQLLLLSALFVMGGVLGFLFVAPYIAYGFVVVQLVLIAKPAISRNRPL